MISRVIFPWHLYLSSFNKWCCATTHQQLSPNCRRKFYDGRSLKKCVPSPPKKTETISSNSTTKKQHPKNNTQNPHLSRKNRRNLSLAFLFLGLLFFRLFLLPRHRMASKVENWRWGFFSTMCQRAPDYIALKINYYSHYIKYTCIYIYIYHLIPPSE